MTTATPVMGVAPAEAPASTALRVVVVNGSPSQPSRTMGLVDVILDTLAGMLPVEVSRIDVYRLGPGFTGAIERDDVTPEVEAALRQTEQADLLVAATPVFRGSYPGMFKHFFDLVDQYALANKLVLLAATGGGDHHALALEHALRPLFAFFQALTVPIAIFASAGDFDGTLLLNPHVHGRIQVGLTDVADLLRTRATGTRATPGIQPQPTAGKDRPAQSSRARAVPRTPRRPPGQRADIRDNNEIIWGVTPIAIPTPQVGYRGSRRRPRRCTDGAYRSPGTAYVKGSHQHAPQQRPLTCQRVRSRPARRTSLRPTAGRQFESACRLPRQSALTRRHVPAGRRDDPAR